MFIDSHAHLTSEQFNIDREETIKRALDAGVHLIVNPATDLEDSLRAIELAEKHDCVYACVGFHPHEARKADEKSLQQIEELSRHPKVVAIGEIGLDFYYDFSPREQQEEVFKAQIAIAQRRNLPIVIHTRESNDATLTIVRDAVTASPEWRSQKATPESRYSAPKGVFHCFSGDVRMAWEVINMGFYISMPGIVTFKKAELATEVASKVSCEHFLLETDSPYLAPTPHRGKRNEPANIPLIAEKIAALQHLSVEDIARATNYSAYRLFGIGEVGKPQFTYALRNSLYVNLTIRCDADCVFCDRKGEAVIKGINLRIEGEPTVEEVIAGIGDPKQYAEIVFCGYGEPTIRLDAIKTISQWVKAHGGRTRINTDGHGSIINKRNIVPELVGLIDAVSISLNSTDPQQYGELMRVDGARFFPAMIEFAKESVRLLPKVIMTVVDLDVVDKEKARRLVEEEIGAVFQTRPYF
ncbi:MAG: YchF/TatD family DNA exonuclease [Ignavibacteriae bacterium]|nr:YchF/TatD family DNA exonuclease [Ignavibacteriota bacterium]